MEYFPRSRARRRSPTPPPRVWLSENDIDTPSQSIYIFPNPSSVLPSPHSNLNDASLESAVREPVEESRSRSISVATAATTTTDTGWDDLRSPSNYSTQDETQWEWPTSADGHAVDGARLGEEEAVLDEEIVGASRWDLIASRRYPAHPLAVRAERQARLAPTSTMSWIRSRTVSGVSSLSSYVAVPTTTPHPRMRIPLLSFFGSLLDIDEETLDLLESTPSQSTLFTGPLDEGVACAATEEERAHGLELLLKGDENMLREGVRAFCEAESDEKSLDFLSVSALWRLVGEMWQGRRAASREPNAEDSDSNS
ncbi:hypothetical protein PENSPDRAFT_648526 [Peniophora sp. CONT]|nr:hypothetical protein PENSPDRAFT_648526 [Peniophora sp. CONT]